MIVISGELINRDTSQPKDNGSIEPSSEATLEEVEELEATDICVIVDSKGCRAWMCGDAHKDNEEGKGKAE